MLDAPTKECRKTINSMKKEIDKEKRSRSKRFRIEVEDEEKMEGEMKYLVVKTHLNSMVVREVTENFRKFRLCFCSPSLSTSL